MALIATRPLSIRGRSFKTGQTVPRTLFDRPGKIEQLVSLRMLKDTDQRKCKYKALRTIELGEHKGKDAYRRGDLVDVSALDPLKIAQLLDHRIIEPIAA